MIVFSALHCTVALICKFGIFYKYILKIDITVFFFKEHGSRNYFGKLKAPLFKKSIFFCIVLAWFTSYTYLYIDRGCETEVDELSCVSQQHQFAIAFDIYIFCVLSWGAHNCCRKTIRLDFWCSDALRDWRSTGAAQQQQARQGFRKVRSSAAAAPRSLSQHTKYPWGWGGETREFNCAVLLSAAAARGGESAAAHTSCMFNKKYNILYIFTYVLTRNCEWRWRNCLATNAARRDKSFGKI